MENLKLMKTNCLLSMYLSKEIHDDFASNQSEWLNQIFKIIEGSKAI